jgi:hypothetical protein
MGKNLNTILMVAFALVFGLSTVVPLTSAQNSADRVDINSATKEELEALPGIAAWAQKIIDGRPYSQPSDLVKKYVMSKATYNKVKDRIIANPYSPSQDGNQSGASARTGEVPPSTQPSAPPSINEPSSIPSSVGVTEPRAAAPGTAAASNTPNSSSRFISGLPQCARTQYENRGASLWITNSCNVAVTVEFTSDSGNTWGETSVGPGNRAEVRTMGMYDPRKDGTVYLFTCPKDSQPVQPNGDPLPLRNYKGTSTCAKQ